MPIRFSDRQIQIAQHLCILAGYVGTVIIVVLSLVPPSLRPHTGVGGKIEHWIAYALVGLAFGLGQQTARLRLRTGIALSAAAALLELLQNFIPGRNPEVVGFLSSSMGTWMGLGLASIALVSLRAITK